MHRLPANGEPTAWRGAHADGTQKQQRAAATKGAAAPYPIARGPWLVSLQDAHKLKSKGGTGRLHALWASDHGRQTQDSEQHPHSSNAARARPAPVCAALPPTLSICCFPYVL